MCYTVQHMHFKSGLPGPIIRSRTASPSTKARPGYQRNHYNVPLVPVRYPLSMQPISRRWIGSEILAITVLVHILAS